MVASSLIETIKSIDTRLFLALNHYHTPFLDTFFTVISYKFTWIPLYALFLYLLIKTYKKNSIWYIAGAAAVVILTDQISVHLFKEVFQRYRPCHNLEIKHIVHIVNNHCGGKYGFISSHAANSFGIATFMVLALHHIKKQYKIILLFWALLVAYSRIYLGVHYPADIAVGTLLGISIAMAVYFFIHKIAKKI